MKRDITLKGRSIEEKLNSVELILNRLSRKLGTKVIGVMPISPIFHYSFNPGDGEAIAKILFPASGIITKIAFHVDRRGKRPFKIKIELFNDLLKIDASKTVTVTKTTEIADLSMEVNAGDRAVITYLPIAEDEIVNGIWFSMLYQIESKHLRTKTYLLEDLDKLITKDVSDVQDY